MNVTRSDYYYHTKNPINSYKEANQKLDVEIKRVYDDSKGRYGSPKITKQLKNEGIKVSQKRVARRMKILGLRSGLGLNMSTAINIFLAQVVKRKGIPFEVKEPTTKEDLALVLEEMNQIINEEKNQD